jgi:hypothetical protein
MTVDPPPFAIEQTETDGRVVLTLHGELDLASSPQLEEATQLTGRTKVWSSIAGIQRPWLAVPCLPMPRCWAT